jgi:hypothetical protein
MNTLFHTRPIHWTWWVSFTGAGLFAVAVIETYKLVMRRRIAAAHPSGARGTMGPVE